MLPGQRAMDLFKLTIAPHASERDRETTTSEGPFIVAAKDMARARALVAFNFSIAAMRRLGAGVWTDAGPHEVIRLNGVKEDDLRQKMIVAGTDISQWYLDRAVLKEGRRVMARMVWWPCRDGDRCPV
jgi:hypothetical protein